MDCGKFGDCSSSRFVFIVRTNRHTHTQRDAAKRFTPATVVGVSKQQLMIHPDLLVYACTF